MRFESILVAVEADSAAARRALGAAGDLQARSGGRLTVVHVLPEAEARADAGPFGGDVDVVHQVEAATADWLRGLVDEVLPPRGGRVDVQVRRGWPPARILDEAIRIDAGLIVVGARGATGWRGLFLGNTGRDVLCGADRPVLRVSPDGQDGLPVRAVLAATDLSAPAREAVRLAVEIAGEHEAHLHLLHVIEIPPRGLVLDGGPYDADLRKLVASARAGIRERLGRELSEVGCPARIATTLHIGQGTPSREIDALADRVGADLIVLASLGRSGLTDTLLGSTAERVMRGTGRPVLVVKGGASPRPDEAPARAFGAPQSGTDRPPAPRGVRWPPDG